MFLLLPLLLLLSACAGAPPRPAPVSSPAIPPARPDLAAPGDPLARARNTITARDLLTGIEKLASDEFEGRAPGTHGEAVTVDWLKARFKAVGLLPAGEGGSWTQIVPMVAYTSQPQLTLSIKGKPHVLAPQRDFVAWSPAPLSEVAVDNSDVVFVGYGVIAPEYGWNDYKGMDLRGKTLLMLINDPQVPDRNRPDRLDPAMFKGAAMTYYGRWTYKYEMAARLGAAAVLIVHDTSLAAYPWSVVVNSWGQENYILQSATANSDYPLVPGWIEGSQARTVLAAAGYDLDALRAQAVRSDFRPVSLPIRARFRIQNHWREVRSANVIGRIAGSDPALRHEAVVYTAHWDHFGRDEHRNGDPVYHGAIDNASGVSGMLQIAQAMAQARPAPRRSIVFIATTAEERNQLGARWYVRHPVVPLARTVADINIDGLNPLGRSSGVDVVGYGANTLEDTLLDAALGQGREVFPEARPDSGMAYRSDQIEFARVGVPTLFVTANLRLRGHNLAYAREHSEDYARHAYHTPLDVVRDDWDLSGAVEDLQLLLDVGYRTANRDEPPQWKPGAEFHRP
ncbi:MAG: M20/M25/M40 family metallo-hydrolase [Pseudomonadota bacterium]|nr:M20/M25/M40 family metallo-hydrolase [Pseudomonadota bacterium]